MIQLPGWTSAEVVMVGETPVSQMTQVQLLLLESIATVHSYILLFVFYEFQIKMLNLASPCAWLIFANFNSKSNSSLKHRPAN